MKKTYLLLILILLPNVVLNAQVQGFNLIDRYFTKYSQEDCYIYTYSVLADSDRLFSGGVSLIEDDAQRLSSRALISAYDFTGKKLFQKPIGMPHSERTALVGFANIQKVNVNEYVFGGVGFDKSTRPEIGGLEFPFVYFFDKNGDSLSSFSLRDSFVNRELYGLTLNNEKELIGIGLETSRTGYYDSFQRGFVADYSNYWLMKLNKERKLIWQKHYPDFWSEVWGATPTKLIVDTDQKGYLIAGMLNFDGYAHLLKVDSSGNEIWKKTIKLREDYTTHPDITGAINEVSIDIAVAPGGGYYFVTSMPYTGISESDTSIKYDNLAYCYGKLNTNGDTLWTKVYAPLNSLSTYFGRQIRVADNGDLIMTGNMPWPNYVMQNFEDGASIFRADSAGNIKWYRQPESYSSEQNQKIVTHQIYSLSLVPGKDAIFTGGRYIGNYDPNAVIQQKEFNTYSWLMLTDSLGRRCEADTAISEAPSPCETVTFGIPPSSDTSFILYPNPAYDYVNIEMIGVPGVDLYMKDKVQLRIFDMQGREVNHIYIQRRLKTKIDISYLSRGVYIFQIWNDDKKAKYWKVVKL